MGAAIGAFREGLLTFFSRRRAKVPRCRIARRPRRGGAPEEDARRAAFADRKYRLALGAVVEAAKRYEAGQIGWSEFDAVIHGYTMVAKELRLVFQRPRRERLGLADGEERGEFEWDPIHELALDQRQRRVPRKLRDLETASLEEAVAALTSEATAAKREDLVRSVDDWRDVVLQRMKTNDFSGFLEVALGGVREGESFKRFERWMALIQNIWNTTPMPDRGDRTCSRCTQLPRHCRDPNVGSSRFHYRGRWHNLERGWGVMSAGPTRSARRYHSDQPLPAGAANL